MILRLRTDANEPKNDTCLLIDGILSSKDLNEPELMDRLENLSRNIIQCGEHQDLSGRDGNFVTKMGAYVDAMETEIGTGSIVPEKYAVAPETYFKLKQDFKLRTVGVSDIKGSAIIIFKLLKAQCAGMQGVQRIDFGGARFGMNKYRYRVYPQFRELAERVDSDQLYRKVVGREMVEWLMILIGMTSRDMYTKEDLVTMKTSVNQALDEVQIDTRIGTKSLSQENLSCCKRQRKALRNKT